MVDQNVRVNFETTQSGVDISKGIAGAIRRINGEIGSIVKKSDLWQTASQGVKNQLDAINRGKALARQVADAKRLGISVKNVNSVFKAMNATLKGSGSIARKAFKNTSTQIQKASKATFKFRGDLLGILFFGQAIQRVFGRALKSIFNSYLEVTDNNNALTEGVNRLNAGFQFLKFSLVDALSQSPLFIELLNGIISMVDYISNLVGKYPALAKGIVIFLAIAFVIGFLLFLSATLALGIQSIAFNFGLLKTAIGFLSGPLGVVLGIVVVVIGTIIALYKIWTSKSSLVIKILQTIGVVLIAIGLIMFLLGSPIFLIAAAIGVVILLVVAFRKQIYKAMLIAGEAISNFFIATLNIAIRLINKVITAMNKIPKVDIGLINEVDELDFSDKIAAVDAEIKADKLAKEQAKSGTTSKDETVNETAVVNNFIDAKSLSPDELQNMMGQSFDTKFEDAGRSFGAPETG